jgi:hypothetical protein
MGNHKKKGCLIQNTPLTIKPPPTTKIKNHHQKNIRENTVGAKSKETSFLTHGAELWRGNSGIPLWRSWPMN